MFKTVKPVVETGFVFENISQFPHCDSRVLHAPGECKYCDEHPDWQALRISWGIAFTGYEPDKGELPCPAWYARGENCQKWSGNIAVTPEVEKAWEEYWKEVKETLENIPKRGLKPSCGIEKE